VSNIPQIPEPHEYDGIREEQNQLPRWWLSMFFITTAFAVLYFEYYQLGPGPSQQTEFEAVVKAHEEKHPKPTGGVATEEEFKRLEKDPAALAQGKNLFAQRCLVCHGTVGQGQVGPNLTDNFWIHGEGSPTSISEVIKNGVPAKGMPAWGPLLTPVEIAQVSVYVRSLHGTNPPGAKAPQGVEVKE